MKNNWKNIFKNRPVITYGLIFIAGLVLGRIFFGGFTGDTHAHNHDHEHEAENQIWTCSMHPQIRQDKPGKCPLCAMDLTPLVTSGSDGEAVHPDAIQITREAIALANIQTTTTELQSPVKKIRLYGTVEVDERLSQSQTSHAAGRIEELFVNFTGESISRGQTIATVYSPDLLNAQQELLEAVKYKDVQPALYNAVKEKLHLFKVTDEQIAQIEESGKVNPVVEIKATTSGIVSAKLVNQGDYVSQGAVLYNVTNLSRVWVMLEAYEQDLPFIRTGENIEFSLQAVPDKIFSGRVSFIDPFLNSTTRTAKIRIETANQNMQLKPGMYAEAVVEARMKNYENGIVVPKSAVLWTGKRSIVYVKQPDTEIPAFMLREIELGPSLDGAYVVLSGLEEGDEVVTNGAFTIDATAQLEGRRSMMNMDEDEHGHHGHEHYGEHAMLSVSGACGMCKETIEAAAKSVKGVSLADWDMEKKELHLHFDSEITDVKAVSRAIAGSGYDTEFDKADDDIYESLHVCCKYRDL